MSSGITLLQRLNPDRNERRYYRVEVGPCIGSRYAVHRVWGRIGHRRSGFLITPCIGEAEAQRLAEKWIARKLKRGYLKGPVGSKIVEPDDLGI